tara:strand:- start:49 stop:492 length:444 start_codon:yes stop_codon:yes gene_type:complete
MLDQTIEARKALIKAQKEMGKALKNATNPHFRSNYADLKSVVEAVMPAFLANGFAVTQPNGANELGDFVQTILMHENGATFVSRVYLRLGKQDMQGYGSATTYARRYGLLGMAGIAPEDDDGNAAVASSKNKSTWSSREPLQSKKDF